ERQHRRLDGEGERIRRAVHRVQHVDRGGAGSGDVGSHNLRGQLRGTDVGRRSRAAVPLHHRLRSEVAARRGEGEGRSSGHRRGWRERGELHHAAGDRVLDRDRLRTVGDLLRASLVVAARQLQRVGVSACAEARGGLERDGDGDRGGATAETDGLDTVTITLDRKSTRLNSSHSQISYAVFCLKKKKKKKKTNKKKY